MVKKQIRHAIGRELFSHSSLLLYSIFGFDKFKA